MIEDITDNLLSDEKVAELENAMNSKNFKKVYKLSKKYHRQGIIAATHILSVLYRYGLHVEQDSKKEFEYLQISYEANHITSVFDIGLSLLAGRITEKNIPKGLRILQGLADDGYEPAIHFLIQNSISSGQISTDKLEKAGIKPIAEFEIPVSDIDEDTNKMLSKMIANSNSGEIAFSITNKNTEEILVNKMLKDFFDNLKIDIKISYSIANNLNTMKKIEGYFALGILYCFGIHVKMDIEKGMSLLLKAFVQGCLPASYIAAIVLGSTGKMQKSKDISLVVMKNLADDGYKPAIEALKESSDGMPEGVHLSYEYLYE